MTTRRSLLRCAATVTAAATAGVVLAACGADGSTGHTGHNTGASSSAPSAPDSQKHHNAQDVAFAQGMIPHHRQAVAMADLALSRAQAQGVKDLATQIKKAQDPEISTMSGWLKTWGEEVPAGDMNGMEGTGHSGSGHDMPGMMSDADMKKLKKLSGSAFDTAFLQMMIDHHNGAVEQAQTELDKGSYGPAKDLATSIVMSQSAEIRQMKKMLSE